MYPPLTLPPAKLTIRQEKQKKFVLDIIRKKFIQLTPEEWVRQHLIHYFIHQLHYPKSLFKIESGLHYNQLNKRTDIVVMDRQTNPWMIVECKASTVPISQQTVNQAALYNFTLGAKYVALSNGLMHFCYQWNTLEKKPEFLDNFPPYV